MEQDVWTPYCGAAPKPSDLWTSWNLDPVLLAVLAAATLAIILRLRARERAFGIAAMGVLAISFVSPLCALSSALFSARTVHHVLLVGAAAPLLACATPTRRAGPLALMLALQTAVLWGWHAPAAYGAALSDDLTYWLMQLSLLGASVLFWRSVAAASAPASIGVLLAAMIAMGLLGAVLTFADLPLYAPHLLTTTAFGLTPLEDQQTAGLLMWAPASAIYLIAALLRLNRLLAPAKVMAA
ncbi:cytochrome c oxidase assembly protein [Caulobacter segnis]|uniref:cytochrome c oxidase assembly protein n=1 Tax=Caulobacter segnis TaxID=88688 RepID=UPI00240EADBE|nr:cytochrome c oxidase assembly protein [Caulobacter segnis]MDG2520687.1 cytochrome c oxidase assembly protein [Caulobacter segnis]